MKIGIDISQVIYNTGVSVYTRELITHLTNNFPENEYILFGGSLRRGDELRDFAKPLKNTKSVVTPISPTIADLVWNRLHFLDIERLIGRVDVFHTSDWAEPPAKVPKVTTIHDLAPLMLPQFTHPKIVAAHKNRLSWVMRESSGVIVPSESSRRDAIELGIDESKIRVIPEALRTGLSKAPNDQVEKVKRKYRISGRYALSVGNNPRKNNKRAIQAFKKAKVDAGLDRLVIVGQGKGDSTISGVVFTGHVSDAELGALYTGASILLYPSLYEGFGLPILDAFYYDLPVVTSSISSMPEVAADAAVLVDPESVESITDGIIKATIHSKELIKKGRARLKNFNWDKTASMTMELYRSVEQ